MLIERRSSALNTSTLLNLLLIFMGTYCGALLSLFILYCIVSVLVFITFLRAVKSQNSVIYDYLYLALTDFVEISFFHKLFLEIFRYLYYFKS